MRKIGLVGGTGPESTLMYYKELNKRIDDATGDKHMPDMVIPKKQERNLIAKRILEELELGIIKESTLKEFTDIIERMKTEDGIEAVILGCTELPLLLNNENCPVYCLDSVDIHLNKLVELCRR